MTKKQTKPTPSRKNNTNHEPAPKPRRHASVEDIEDADNDQPRVFPRNHKNIIESDEDNDLEASSDTEDREQPAESAEEELSE